MKKTSLIIAGPCAAESELQINQSIAQAERRGVDFLRASLWKPRTKPGFEGLGETGLPLLAKIAQRGLNPATEVLTPEHAEKVIDTVLSVSKNGKVLIWIGARNQNHFLQQEIAKVAHKNSRVVLMVKNQPWPSLEHWEGIIEHILSTGFPKERLLLCHRGFAPFGDNPLGLRNIPDFEMAMDIKQKSGLRMLFDPSHIGGSVEKVLAVAYLSMQYDFDGMITEVHPDPQAAQTDAKQQLTWEQFDSVLRHLHITSGNSAPIHV
ncbi:MAG TPA: hypothetical protein VG935_03715 [Patescibacteria group bacterium]|nr:hypothetical protein [Patescibacteria group bacterium]